MRERPGLSVQGGDNSLNLGRSVPGPRHACGPRGDLGNVVGAPSRPVCEDDDVLPALDQARAQRLRLGSREVTPVVSLPWPSFQRGTSGARS